MKKLDQNLRKIVANTFKCSREKIYIKKYEESVTAICLFLEVDVPGDSLKSIFVKMGKEDAFDEEGRHEVRFYRTVKKESLSLSVPNCHFAGFDDQTDQPIIILEDYSNTHQFLTDWPIPPEIEACKKAISVLAKLHAKFWNHPDLGVNLGSLKTINEIKNGTAEALDTLNEFIDFLRTFMKIEQNTYSPDAHSVVDPGVLRDSLACRSELTKCEWRQARS